MPFDLNDCGVAQWGHLKSTCHILHGIHRKRCFQWYASGDGLSVGNWYGGGYHHRVSLSVSFPFFAVNKLLPIQCLSPSLTIFLQPWGSQRLKSVDWQGMGCSEICRINVCKLSALSLLFRNPNMITYLDDHWRWQVTGSIIYLWQAFTRYGAGDLCWGI